MYMAEVKQPEAPVSNIFPFEGANFNIAWTKKVTLEKFIKHGKETGLSDDKLKEAYKLITAPAPKEKAKPAAQPAGTN